MRLLSPLLSNAPAALSDREQLCSTGESVMTCGYTAVRMQNWPKNETAGITNCTPTVTKRTSAQVRAGGQGRGRTADLPLFSRIYRSRPLQDRPPDLAR